MPIDTTTAQPESGHTSPRGTDRRQNPVGTPPYLTRDGLVMSDRRSHLERRSCWIRTLAIDAGNGEH